MIFSGMSATQVQQEWEQYCKFHPQYNKDVDEAAELALKAFALHETGTDTIPEQLADMEKLL